MKTFRQYLTEEDTHSDLVSAFHKDKSAHGAVTGVKNYGKRDNCGPACFDLMHHAKKSGHELTRVRGYFHADKAVHSKGDFTPEMRKEFHKTGKDFSNKEHRKDFIENHPKYKHEWKKVPHYWTKDQQGNIHDPTGHKQFVKSGLSKDLHPSRYHEDDTA